MNCSALLLPIIHFIAPQLPVQDPEPDVRLVVLVVVDQMIPEQIERMQPWLTGGLKRFSEGEVWLRATHGHAITETGPGHASLGTGSFPNKNGIVSNVWTDYASGEPVYCVGDPAARLLTNSGLGSPGSATSPKNLLVDGFAEYFHRANPAAKAISIAGKDRAAILASGKSADLALWWERGVGAGFCSSDSYASELPAWVQAWNEGWAPRASGWTWEADLEGKEASGMAADVRAGEPKEPLPHRAPDLQGASTTSARAELARWVYVSPLMDEFVLQMAHAAVREEGLGSDQATDYLFIGLSACDTVGHRYGPYSREITDLVLRVDRGLGTFFDELDETIGSEHWIAALSADHGVLPLPEELRAHTPPGERVKHAALAAASRSAQAEVQELFGAPYFQGLSYLDGRLDHERLASVDLAPAEVIQATYDSLSHDLPWLHGYFSRQQLMAAQHPDADQDGLLSLYAHSFHPERSGDFRLVTKPWVLISGGSRGTTHGSPWSYDREVPMAFIGPGFQAGMQHFERSLTVDILPTLLERAGLPVPSGIDGHVLR